MVDALWHELFTWWAISISGGSIFLTLVSIYLYRNSKTKRSENNQKRASTVRVAKDFIFVWVLLGLLVFYIISINIGSPIIFAAGNIVVETILIIYLMKDRKKSDQKSPTGTK
jgi:Flp pilus assembly protein TadB